MARPPDLGHLSGTLDIQIDPRGPGFEILDPMPEIDAIANRHLPTVVYGGAAHGQGNGEDHLVGHQGRQGMNRFVHLVEPDFTSLDLTPHHATSEVARFDLLHLRIESRQFDDLCRILDGKIEGSHLPHTSL